jgi:threonylcarbamoyladenosine tRNA methylthiotransferase MtaB
MKPTQIISQERGGESPDRYSAVSDQDMHKFKITTLGCKVNQSESEAIARSLRASDLTPITAGENADVYIVNTCTVTQKAAMQSRQAIRRAIRSHPQANIIVTGCYAQTASEEIKNIKGVQEIIGQADKYRIPEIINRRKVGATDTAVAEGFSNFLPVSGFGERTRPLLKIQDGCEAFCSYCIVPYARGPSRSLPPQDVLTNIVMLGRAGYHEVVLSGIHLGCYGLDLSPKTSLLELLQAIRTAQSVDRIRLSSIEPCELSEDIIDFVAHTEPGAGSVCHHFHIPLQSGDNEILKNMNRPYTREYFRELILKIHQALPDAAIGVDVLVGFPGESQTAFEKTYSLIERLPVAYLHVFPFSPRKGTPAATFNDKIPPQVLKSRSRKMRELANTLKKAFYQKFVGKRLETLIEGKKDNNTGMLNGRTNNYIPVLIRGGDGLANTLVQVEIDTVDEDNIVYGTVCG